MEHKKKLLVAGSLAYDHLEGDSHVYFGGCGGNIAYNARLLGEDIYLVGMCGDDFEEYKLWLDEHAIDTSGIIHVKDAHTSRASITTDDNGKQVAVFEEGATSHAREYSAEIQEIIAARAASTKMALISPNNPNFMRTVIETCRALEIPYLFDPGQVLTQFPKDELLKFIENSSGCIVNEYEAELLKKHTNLSLEQIIELTPLFIVTEGAKGSRIYWKSNKISIAPKKTNNAKDPTGCGDAYRAGLLLTIQNDFPNLTEKLLKKAGDRGSSLATACLEIKGTQNHHLGNIDSYINSN